MEIGGRRAADLAVSGSLAGEKSWSGGLYFFNPFMASCERLLRARNSSGIRRSEGYSSRHGYVCGPFKDTFPIYVYLFVLFFIFRILRTPV